MSNLLVILFVDVADSVGLYDRLGDTIAARLVVDLLDTLETAVTEHGGRVVKLRGDGLLATFAEAGSALAASERMIAAQERHKVGLKVAVHQGLVVLERDDVYGDGVNLCARLEARARPGEILASDAFVSALPGPLRGCAQLFDEVIVKGRSQPTRIYRIEPAETSERTMLPMAPASRGIAVTLLTLTYGDTRIDLLPGRTVVVGREESCELVIRSPYCSRRHAAIAHVGDRFTVSDTSSNGTFLAPAEGQPLVVRRETVSVTGSGRLGLGLGPDEDAGQIVLYRWGEG